MHAFREVPHHKSWKLPSSTPIPPCCFICALFLSLFLCPDHTNKYFPSGVVRALSQRETGGKPSYLSPSTAPDVVTWLVIGVHKYILSTSILVSRGFSSPTLSGTTTAISVHTKQTTETDFFHMIIVHSLQFKRSVTAVLHC